MVLTACGRSSLKLKVKSRQIEAGDSEVRDERMRVVGDVRTCVREWECVGERVEGRTWMSTGGELISILQYINEYTWDVENVKKNVSLIRMEVVGMAWPETGDVRKNRWLEGPEKVRRGMIE